MKWNQVYRTWHKQRYHTTSHRPSTTKKKTVTKENQKKIWKKKCGQRALGTWLKVKKSKVNRWIYIVLYYKLYYKPLSLKHSDMAYTVLPVTHTRTIVLPAFTPQPQSVTALWLVLIAPTQEGMARLSWLGWVVTYRDKRQKMEVAVGQTAGWRERQVMCDSTPPAATRHKSSKMLK